jgi:hypothetical protein
VEILGVILGIIWTTVFPVVAALIAGIMAALPAEVGAVVAGGASFNGAEIAFRMSPIRFHRKIWLDNGIERNANMPNPLLSEAQTEVVIAPTIVSLTYFGHNGTLLSDYKMKAQLESRNV